jgi:hypothetical protein
MWCVQVGEVAEGEQLITNQGQEWMGIHSTSKKAGSPSTVSKKEAGNRNKGWRVKKSEQ